MTTLVTLFATTNSKSYILINLINYAYLSSIFIANEYAVFNLNYSDDISLIRLFIWKRLLLILESYLLLLLLNLIHSLVLLKIHLLVVLHSHVHVILLLVMELLLLMKVILLLLCRGNNVLVLHLFIELLAHWTYLLILLSSDFLLMNLERILLHWWVVSKRLMCRLLLSFHIHIWTQGIIVIN